jgi:hypothetical protein
MLGDGCSRALTRTSPIDPLCPRLRPSDAPGEPFPSLLNAYRCWVEKMANDSPASCPLDWATWHELSSNFVCPEWISSGTLTGSGERSVLEFRPPFPLSPFFFRPAPARCGVSGADIGFEAIPTPTAIRWPSADGATGSGSATSGLLTGSPISDGLTVAVGAPGAQAGTGPGVRVCRHEPGGRAHA